jgi:hypothetical protein
MKRRDFLKNAGLAVGGLCIPGISHGIMSSVSTTDSVAGGGAKAAAASGTILYNGIELPEVWPPQRQMSFDPMPLPYIKKRPDVVPIDLGRQLFVDTFLIDSTSLKRVSHTPRKMPFNPVLAPETPLEIETINGNPGAATKDGGVWWDPKDQVFKMWYEAGWLNRMAYATSRDGLTWERPDLGIIPGTNAIVPDIVADSSTVWLDHFTDNPDQRFKMFLRSPNGIPGSTERFNYGNCMTSPDGIHWSAPAKTGRCGDRSTMFYNPFRDKWVFSLRNAGNVDRSPIGRYRLYHEDSDFMHGAEWDYDTLPFWLGADYKDEADPYIGDRPQLYNLSAVAYESIMISLPQIHLGPDNAKCRNLGVPKITELKVAYSRDGFNWDRTDRNTFIAAERRKEAWDRGYVQSCGGICAIVGDELWFYYIGFKGNNKMRSSESDFNGMHYGGSTGVAALRRDGFVSLHADDGGEVVTRPVQFSGKHLFVNADCSNGSLTAEVLDKDGNVIPGFEASRCKPMTSDSTIHQLSWRGTRDLSALNGQPVKFRFTIKGKGDIYAFWVSPSTNGESRGYNAAGGPGFNGGIDNEGIKAYEKARSFPTLMTALHK